MGVTAASGSDEFSYLAVFEFVQGQLFDRNPINTVNYASSTINDKKNISGVRINVANSAVTDAQAAGINVSTSPNQQALCRPMISIFK